MKIDHVHAEFVSGNAVSSTVTTHSVVSRDGSGNVHANKFKSVNMELTHNVPTSARTSDTVFYSSDGDIIRKNTDAGMRESLGLENSATIAATTAATADKIVLRDSYGDIFASNVDVSESFKINGTALANSATIGATTADTANKIAQRDASGDIHARLFRSDYQNQTTIDGGIAYRTSATDNYIRFCTDMGAVRSKIGLKNSATITADTSNVGDRIVLRDASGNFSCNNIESSGDLSFGSSTRQMINLYSTTYGIGVQSSTQYYRTGGGFAWFKGGSHDDTANDPGTNGALAMKLDSTHNLTVSADVTAYSDKRVKTDISKIDNALEKVCSVSGYTYKRTDTGDERKHTGVIAQEVIKVLPEVVHGSEETTYSVAYGNMVGLLIEAIKEMKSKLDIALARIDTLEKKLEA